MMRRSYFEKELLYIKNDEIREIARQGIALLPDYFYHIPASATGKYHPSFATGNEGLYRHVLAAVYIATFLFAITPFTDDEKDMIIVALMLHDGWKQGEINTTNNTIHTHPMVAANVLKNSIKTETDKEREYLEIICNAIACHMGQWNTSKYDSTILPTPKTELEKFVHMCDYLASRKPLEFNFSAVV